MATSTWGNPTATKRVLLIHGITSASLIWSHIAQEFASRGYFVTAPDLPGHGGGRRGSVYTVAALAEALHPLLSATDPPYDIVIGHSLGGVVASALLPHLTSTRPVRVVLVDPPFEVASGLGPFYKKRFGDLVRNPKTPEAYLEERPHWTKEDANLASMSVRLCDAAAVEAIIDQNAPWSFSHQLLAIPDNVKVVVLVADPSQDAYAKEEDMKTYPHITVKTVWGASHAIHFDAPQVVVETALEDAES